MQNTLITNNGVKTICYCIDDKYLFPFAVSLYSLLSNLKDDIRKYRFEVFHSSLDWRKDEVLEFFDEKFPLAHINFREHKSDIRQEIGKKTWFPQAAFTRLEISSILSEVNDRILYLDWDTLILWSIHEIFQTMQPDSSPVFWCVSEHLLYKWLFYDRFPLLKSDRSLFSSVDTYNSWVLTFDPSLFRDMDILWDLLEIWKKQIRIPSADQDLLNILNIEYWWKLIWKIDPKFNLTNQFLWFKNLSGSPYDATTMAKAIDDPIVRHFTGRKPREVRSVENSDVSYLDWSSHLAPINEWFSHKPKLKVSHNLYLKSVAFLHDKIILDPGLFYVLWKMSRNFIPKRKFSF